MSLPQLQDVLFSERERFDLSDANALARNKKLQAYVALLLGAAGTVFQGFTGSVTGLTFSLDAVDGVAVDNDGNMLTHDSAVSTSVVLPANSVIWIHAYENETDTDTDSRRFIDDSSDPATEYVDAVATRRTYQGGLYVKSAGYTTPPGYTAPTLAGFDTSHNFGGSIGTKYLVPIAMLVTDGSGVVGGTYQDARKMWIVDGNYTVNPSTSELFHAFSADPTRGVVSVRTFFKAVASMLKTLGRGDLWWEPLQKNLLQNSDFHLRESLGLAYTENRQDITVGGTSSSRAQHARWFSHLSCTSALANNNARTGTARANYPGWNGGSAVTRDLPNGWLAFAGLFAGNAADTNDASIKFGQEIDRRILSEARGRLLQLWFSFVKNDSPGSALSGRTLRVRVISGTSPTDNLVSGYTGAVTLLDESVALDSVSGETAFGALSSVIVPDNAEALGLLLSIDGIPWLDTTVSGNNETFSIALTEPMLAPTSQGFSQQYRKREGEDEELLYFFQKATEIVRWVSSFTTSTVVATKVIPEMGSGAAQPYASSALRLDATGTKQVNTTYHAPTSTFPPYIEVKPTTNDGGSDSGPYATDWWLEYDL